MKVYGVYDVEGQSEDMEVFSTAEKALDFFVKELHESVAQFERIPVETIRPLFRWNEEDEVVEFYEDDEWNEYDPWDYWISFDVSAYEVR